MTPSATRNERSAGLPAGGTDASSGNRDRGPGIKEQRSENYFKQAGLNEHCELYTHRRYRQQRFLLTPVPRSLLAYLVLRMAARVREGPPDFALVIFRLTFPLPA